MDFEAVKKLLEDGHAMTFEQIGSCMGLSKQRVQQLYATAIQKVKANLTEEQREEIAELLKEPEDTTYETMLETWALQQDRGLHGFWNEKEK